MFSLLLPLSNGAMGQNLLGNEILDRIVDLINGRLLRFFLDALLLKVAAAEQVLVQLALLRVSLFVHAQRGLDLFSVMVIWRIQAVFVDSHRVLPSVKHYLLEAFLAHI